MASFGYYTTFTIDSTKVPSTQTNFTVLINSTLTRLKTVPNGGNVLNSSGFDIRPYSDTALTSALTFYLERYNASTGELVMWIKIASLSSASNTNIYLAYGNSGLTTDGSSGDTWAAGTLAVWGFSDGTTLSAKDFRGVSSLDGTINGQVGSDMAAVGKVDGAAVFDGTDDYITAPVSAGSALDLTANPATMDFWIKPNSFAVDQVIVGKGTNTGGVGGGDKGYGCLIYGAGPTINVGSFGGGNFNALQNLSIGTWYHVVVVINGASSAIYINGVDQTPPSHTVDVDAISALFFTIGAAQKNDLTGYNRFLNGTLDNMKIHNTALSLNWAITEYNNQSSPSTFYSIGSEVFLLLVESFGPASLRDYYPYLMVF